MRTWGPKSARIITELDPRLQILVTRIRDEVADISLVYGYRGPDEQNEMYARGSSTKKWPDSLHNKRPALAVDLQPHPYPKSECKLWGALGYIAGRAHDIATQEGFTIRWGGDWNGNGDLTDQNFDDLFHIEVAPTDAHTLNSYVARFERLSAEGDRGKKFV